MSFKFNFDLPADEVDGEGDIQVEDAPTTDGDTSDAISARYPAKSHSLDELLSLLPDIITYTIHEIPLSSSTTLSIPRRDLYDVKLQLMNEDTMANGASTVSDPTRFTAALSDSDIRTNTYEGGLKTWECSIDLSKELSKLSPEELFPSRTSRVLELGCGTAYPSCTVLMNYLRQALSSSPGNEEGRSLHLSLADYNLDVLRLVTLPNLLLSTIHSTTPPESLPAARDDSGAPVSHDLEITPEVKESFKSTLSKHQISISFFSGSWGQEMIQLIHGREFPETDKEKLYTMVLGSETIYSLESIPEFLRMLEYTLGDEGKGYVAAKEVYFGVGGSVKDFVAGIEGKGWAWRIVGEEMKGTGVGRVVGVVTR